MRASTVYLISGIQLQCCMILQILQSDWLRYEALSVPFPSMTISSGIPRFLFTGCPGTNTLLFTLVKRGEAPGVVLANAFKYILWLNFILGK